VLTRWPRAGEAFRLHAKAGVRHILLITPFPPFHRFNRFCSSTRQHAATVV
jgi:hypothetical protein